MFAFAFPLVAVLKFVWAIAGTTILGGVAALVAKGLKALHINISNAQQDQLVQVVVDAVHYAEEQGAVKPMTSQQKLAAALSYIQSRAVDAAKPLTVEQLTQLVQSVLSQQGLGASGKGQ